MSQSLKINNFSELNLLETSQLNADALVGDTTLTAVNNQGMTNGDYILLGAPGTEACELIKLASVSGSTGLTSTIPLVRGHIRFDRITKLYGDQIKIYRANNVDGSTPADGAFTVIGIINLDYDGTETIYVDATAVNGSDYWYKAIFYNSTTMLSTDISAALAMRGGSDRYYCSVAEIREEAGLKNNRNITDAEIAVARSQAQAVIDGALNGVYNVPFVAPISPMIKLCAVKWAAGNILLGIYNVFTPTDNRGGQAKINEVTNKDGTGYLDRLAKKDLVLTDAKGADLSNPGQGAGGFSAWPDATTADESADNGGAVRKFRTSDRY